MIGGRIVKHYDAPRTPYQRALATGLVPAAQRAPRDRQWQTLDPVALARDLHATLDVLWKLTDTRRTRSEAARGEHNVEAPPPPFGNTYF